MKSNICTISIFFTINKTFNIPISKVIVGIGPVDHFVCRRKKWNGHGVVVSSKM